jgi:sulfur-oxidizing protein SoxX
MKFLVLAAGATALAMAATSSFAQHKPQADAALVDRYVAATFKGASDEWKKRIEQDASQKSCSQYRNELPAAEVQTSLAREKAAVKFPADGKVIGDWKRGQQLAQRGTGGQFSDGPATPKGGNCYACHQLSSAELSYGTMGPSLTEYGKIRMFSAAGAKDAYAKIYNAQAVFPCSNMPRFGHNGFLNEQEIMDVVAYLFDPDSPVNK